MNVEVAEEEKVRTTRAVIKYLADGPFVTRRFVSAGEEHSTGRYEDHEVTIRDGRDIRRSIALDTHGFVLADHASAIADFRDKDAVEARYQQEACELIKSLTGASHVLARGWMVRTSGELPPKPKAKIVGYQHYGGVQPPAGEAHVDFAPETARRVAENTWRAAVPGGPGYFRLLFTP